MNETFQELETTFNQLKTDFIKFSNSQNKAAGKRARKAAMDIKKLCHTLRQEITEEIGSL